MKDEDMSTLRKMLIRQCKIAYRLGDEKQKREAEFFHQMIAATKTPKPEDHASDPTKHPDYTSERKKR